MFCIIARLNLDVKRFAILFVDFLILLWYPVSRRWNAMSIGSFLQYARKKSGLTQRQLAERLKISPVGVAQWEKDKRNPKADTMKRIALALNPNCKEMLQQGEPVDYADLFVAHDERVHDAAEEVKAFLDEKVYEEEACGNKITLLQKRLWASEQVKIVIGKYFVGSDEVLDQLFPKQNALLNPYPDFQDPNVQKVLQLMALMNSKGRSAVLRHVQELSEIPSYVDV